MAKKKRSSARTAAKAREASATPPPAWFDAWERLGLAKQHLVCALLLIAAAFMFFAPVHFSGKTLVGGDTTRWRAMAESVIDYRETTGDEALWATHAFSGMPAYALSYPTLVPQLDEIPRALRSFLWPTSHVLFLLGGMYLLLFFFTRSPLTSVFSAVAFGMTTYIPVLLIAGHNSKIIALCFAPWLLVGFAYALRKPGLLSGLLFAIACAINLRAGHYQITYYLVFICGIWWLVEGVVAMRQKQALAFAKSTAWLVVGSVLALLMIAQPTLSVLEYKDFSQRGMASGGAAGEGSLAWDYAMAWSHAGHELWTLLIANAAGGGSGEGLYWGPKIFTEGPHYVGGLVVVLAVLALVKVRTTAVWGLGLATFFMLLFALGENFELLNRFAFNYLPFFDAWRVPETWLNAVALTLAVLAGFGLHYATTWAREASARTETTKAVQYAFAGATVLVVLLMVGKTAFFDFEKEGEFDLYVQQVAQSNNVSPSDPRVLQTVETALDGIRDERIAAFNADALRTLLFIVLGGLLLIGARYRKLPIWLALLLVSMLAVIDLTGVARRYLNDDRLTRATDAEATIERFDFDRFLLDRKTELGGDGHFRVLSFERGDPMQNARPSYYHESLGGYHAAKLRYYQDYIDHVYGQGGLPNENAIDLLNGRYIVSPVAFPGTQEVFRSQDNPQLAVYENPDAVDRAFFVSATEVVDAPEAAWARLRDDTFDPNTTALVLGADDLSTTPIDSASTASVTLETYGPREITWALDTDADRLLVVSEVYYPEGWAAYLDGEEVPIYRVNYLLRGVAVPAGQHTLTMRFTPTSHTLGTTIAGTTTALVYGGVLLLLGLGWRRRQASPETP